MYTGRFGFNNVRLHCLTALLSGKVSYESKPKTGDKNKSCMNSSVIWLKWT